MMKTFSFTVDNMLIRVNNICSESLLGNIDIILIFVSAFLFTSVDALGCTISGMATEFE